jgi:hypothetical protein
MLCHAVEKFATQRLSDQDHNAFVESFAIHVRCLRDFLWGKRGPHNPEDAFASDFCDPGVWETGPPALPAALKAIEGKRQRIGREIVHLTYHRLDIKAETKDWDLTELMRAIADGLHEFAKVAKPERLHPKLRPDRLWRSRRRTIGSSSRATITRGGRVWSRRRSRSPGERSPSTGSPLTRSVSTSTEPISWLNRSGLANGRGSDHARRRHCGNPCPRCSGGYRPATRPVRARRGPGNRRSFSSAGPSVTRACSCWSCSGSRSEEAKR